jgi:hypothetical protein
MNISLFTRIAERPVELWCGSQNLVVIYRYRAGWYCDVYSVLTQKIARLEQPFKNCELNSLRTVLGYVISNFDNDWLFFQGADWSPEVESEFKFVLGDIEISQCPLVLVPDCSNIETNDN